jgi:hypothetical protein
VQGELPAGGRDIEEIADGDLLMQIAAGRAVRFPLDADAVAALWVRRAGQRVISDHGRSVRARAKPQGQVLAGLHRGRHRRIVGRKETQRGDGGAVELLGGDAHRSKAIPRGMSGLGRLVAQSLEALAPSSAQRRDVGRAPQRFAGVSRKVEQHVDLSDREPLGAVGDLGDRLAGFDESLLEDPQVEAGRRWATRSVGIAGLSMRIPTQ